ncbi:MAG: metal-dependent hydrolase [Burkholderiales bacterium]|nr:metal-dependent hydrolase [Burkholderiales bacterium]
MGELTVRRLHVDLAAPIARHWCGGDAFRTALFNALSMSFPVGEQFFIDAVRAGMAVLPQEARARFEAEARGFIGQEATHRRIHALFNAHLARQGLDNAWERRGVARFAAMKDLDARHKLGITAATEHITAILSEWALAHPEASASDDPRLTRMWHWHFCEEIEHKATTIDLYRAIGGNHAWRVRYFRTLSAYFLADLARQTWSNLWRDGSWWRPSTWASAWALLFGRFGLVRALIGPWRAYLREDFHPSQLESGRHAAWLAAHPDAYSRVSP